MANKKRKRKTGILPKIILLAFVVYSATLLISLQMKINENNRAKADIEQQIMQEEEKQTGLRQLLEDDLDESYIVSEAQKQGYAYPSERVFSDVSGQ